MTVLSVLLKSSLLLVEASTLPPSCIGLKCLSSTPNQEFAMNVEDLDPSSVLYRLKFRSYERECQPANLLNNLENCLKGFYTLEDASQLRIGRDRIHVVEKGVIITSGFVAGPTVTIGNWGMVADLKQITILNGTSNITYTYTSVQRRVKNKLVNEFYLSKHGVITFTGIESYASGSDEFQSLIEYCGTANGKIFSVKLELLPYRSGVEITMSKGDSEADNWKSIIKDRDISVTHKHSSTGGYTVSTLRIHIGVISIDFSANDVQVFEPGNIGQHYTRLTAKRNNTCDAIGR